MSADVHLRAAIDALVEGIHAALPEAAAEDRARAVEAATAEVTARASAVHEDLRRAADAQAAALETRTDSRIKEATASMEAAEQARMVAETQLAALRQELHETQAALARADATRAASEARLQALASVETERVAEAGALWVLTGAARGLEEAQSLGDVFDTLARAARQVAEPATVHLVSGSVLHEWSRTSGQPAAAGTGPWLSGEPRQAEHRYPVRVAGAVVTVVVVQTAPGDDATVARSHTLSLLTAHAGLVLEAMTLRRSTGLFVHEGRLAHVRTGTGGPR